MTDAPFTAEYVGGQSGSPNDYGIRYKTDGHADLGLVPINRIVLLVHGYGDANMLADLLNKSRAIYLPETKRARD